MGARRNLSPRGSAPRPDRLNRLGAPLPGLGPRPQTRINETHSHGVRSNRSRHRKPQLLSSTPVVQIGNHVGSVQTPELAQPLATGRRAFRLPAFDDRVQKLERFPPEHALEAGPEKTEVTDLVDADIAWVETAVIE